MYLKVTKIISKLNPPPHPTHCLTQNVQVNASLMLIGCEMMAIWSRYSKVTCKYHSLEVIEGSRAIVGNLWPNYFQNNTLLIFNISSSYVIIYDKNTINCDPVVILNILRNGVSTCDNSELNGSWILFIIYWTGSWKERRRFCLQSLTSTGRSRLGPQSLSNNLFYYLYIQGLERIYLTRSRNIDRFLVFKQDIDPIGTLEKSVFSGARPSDVGSLFDIAKLSLSMLSILLQTWWTDRQTAGPIPGERRTTTRLNSPGRNGAPSRLRRRISSSSSPCRR